MQLPELRRGSKPLTVLVILAAVIGGLSMIGYSQSGKTKTASPTTSSTTSASSSTTAASGPRLGIDVFGAIGLDVTPSGGTAKKYCALLAHSAEAQAKGMMGRTDLGGYDGMVFYFDADTNAQFYMANVTVPLSIAWVTSDGKVIKTMDMPPCTGEAKSCPRYSADGTYRYAIETLKGGLDPLGISTSSTVSATGTCA